MNSHFQLTFSLFLMFIISFLGPMHGQDGCDDASDTFEVFLPVVNDNIYEVGFKVDPIWRTFDVVPETIEIPNGRPIYALIVSGYASNQYLDEIMLYDFVRSIHDKGGYVHYSWWNNLLAPYMERPLHNSQSEPGNLRPAELAQNFSSLKNAKKKALPAEDYQFVADAKILLKTIRANNPDAIIIVAGHSMGGGAVVHLADELGKEDNPIDIDILAPIDPVGNRNLPWSGVGRQPFPESSSTQQINNRDYNFTRWRVSRDGFRGYKYSSSRPFSRECVPSGDWLVTPSVATDKNCVAYFHEAPTIRFGTNVKNFYHRYQREDKFPYDYKQSYHFRRLAPPGAIDIQAPVVLKGAGEDDPGGWPDYIIATRNLDAACCTNGDDGKGFAQDGHGEIIGYRGPVFVRNPANGSPVPLGIRMNTSPQCGDQCDDLTWPVRSFFRSTDEWDNGNGTFRKTLLRDLEDIPLNVNWFHKPVNPRLCLVSKKRSGQGFDGLTEVLNKIMPAPPIANAGEDQELECTGMDGTTVTLDGSASERAACYNWNYTDMDGNPASISGEIVDVDFGLGEHLIELVVTDVFGREDRDDIVVTIVDTTPPEISVSLDPDWLWPPNHRMIDITANVEAMDLCSEVQTELSAIEASEADDVIGSGNTSPDISDADFGTADYAFKLRAERSGRNGSRIYTVTYTATDDSGNSAMASAVVIVENPADHYNRTGRLSSNIHLSSSNHPNPFRTMTRIDYELYEDDDVTIAVYDMRGRLVNTVFNGTQKAGNKSVFFDGSYLAAGVYVYQIEAPKNGFMSNRMVIRR